MKLIFSFLILFTLKAQSQQIEIIKFNAADTSSIADNNVYLINNEDFDELLNLGSSEYKLVYTYAAWCKPCVETLPEVLDLVARNKNNIDFYLITAQDENNINEFKRIR